MSFIEQCVVVQVLLTYKGKGFCGGAIYKPTWILTAAHCMENTDIRYLKVVAGTSPWPSSREGGASAA